jgi:hypothetical protein
MPLWLAIAKSPLAIFVLGLLGFGLLRSIAIAIWNILATKPQASDSSKIPFGQPFRQGESVLPITNPKTNIKPVYAFASLYFLLGTLICALFLSSHLEILSDLFGYAWTALPKTILDWVALLAILGDLYILFYRLYTPQGRAALRWREEVLLVTILVILVSGYLAGKGWNPIPYNSLMLVHTLCSLIVMSVAPFTPILQALLGPDSLLVRHQTPMQHEKTAPPIYTAGDWQP